ncbi:MAG: RNA methyltransferase [Lachnospiraceae bacterium]|nr:RNA methyltransferase [Lachnospiraceae bacterium]
MEIIRVNDTHDTRVQIFTELNETQLLHYYEPNGGLFVAESPMVIGRALDKGYEPVSFFFEEKFVESDEGKKLIDSISHYNVPIYTAPRVTMNEITGYNITRGALCAFMRREHEPASEFLKRFNKVVFLEDVMNPTNVGAIFRSAAALGAEAVVLTDSCADPLYRRAARVSMGTVFTLPFTYFDKDSDYMELLKSCGFTTVSLALRDDALPLYDSRLKGHDKLAVIFGTESTGIKESTLSLSDYTAIIPMQNGVDSLNVAAASAVTFFELFGKH